LAEAVRAVLAGEPIPIPGINKKDAKLLVRDGAKEGRSVASIGDEFTEVSWPKAEYAGNTESLWCSRFAVGLEHLFDLDTKERSKVLARYVNSTPTVGDLGQAMRDIGYGDKAIDKTWGAIQTEGWDSTHKKAREHGTKLKGQWEGVAREKYGAKKAEGWTPTNYPDMAVVLKHDPEDDPREVILATIERARARVKETVGSAAVSQAEVDRLKALADEKPENVKPLQKDLKKLQADLEAVEAERRALPAEGKNGANTVCDCPKCGAKLTVEQAWQGPVMLKPYDEDAEKQASSKEMRLKRSELDGKAANLKGKINEAHRRIAADENDADRIAEAKKRLAEIGDYKEPDIETVRAAEQAEADARATLAAFDAKVGADRLHAEIQKNEQLAGVLAPDGLRKRKLAAGLETFNGKLAELCAAAKWPVVRIDENLAPHYGTRPLWGASASGQWRARVVAQVAMAGMDGSAAVVIDEADILDSRGRNALLALLQHAHEAANLRALVCMTLSSAKLMPDLDRAGIGRSFWVHAGVVQAMTELSREEAA
jgi:hypothetical protein